MGAQPLPYLTVQQCVGARGRRGPSTLIDSIGNHRKAIPGDAKPHQDIGLQLGEDNHPVVASQEWCVKRVSELLGPGREIAQTRIKRRVKRGHQRNLQLLAKLRQAEIKGRQGEAGMDDVRSDALQRFAQFPLRARRGNGVNLRFDQVREADVWVVGQQ